MLRARLVTFICLALTAWVAVPSAAVASQGRGLELQSTEVVEQHGLILRAIGRGELDAGVSRLESLRENPRAAEIVDRVDKDLVRCRALIELRAKHIYELVEKRKRVTLDRRHDKLHVTVTAFASGRLTAEDPKSGALEFAADELQLAPLARSFGPKTLEGVDPAVRGYAYVLAEDAKGIASVKGSPLADELRAESESTYKPLLELGAAAEMLTRLAELGTPASPEAASEVALTLERLAPRFKDFELVSSRRVGLSALGSAAYPLLFNVDDLLAGVCAKLERLSDGVVRLTYDFTKVRKLTDFVADHEYLTDIRKQYSGFTLPARELAISGGALRVSGSGLWRHVLDFTGPIKVDFTFAFESTSDPSVFCVGVNDDRADSFVLCRSGVELLVRDIPTRLVGKSPAPPELRFNQLQQFAGSFTVADEVATLSLDRKEVARVRCAARSNGNVLLFVSGERQVLFHRMVIEARLDTDGLRARWTQRKLAELGL